MRSTLHTIHGSRLYGLSNHSSDRDYYSVIDGVDKGYIRHWIDGEHDITELSLDKFLDYCSQGVPQALEALTSPVRELQGPYASLLKQFRPGIRDVQQKYRRTISNFLQPGQPDKKRKHAVRLCFNLSSWVREGYMNPQLSKDELLCVHTMYTWDTDTLEDMLGMALLGELEAS